jgi:hypothetical protein
MAWVGIVTNAIWIASISLYGKRFFKAMNWINLAGTLTLGIALYFMNKEDRLAASD